MVKRRARLNGEYSDDASAHPRAVGAGALERDERTISGPVAQQLKARNQLLSQPVHHRSLNELPVERSGLLKPAKSLSNLAMSCKSFYYCFALSRNNANRVIIFPGVHI